MNLSSDEARHILYFLDDESLLRMCSLNRRFSQKICSSDFWIKKIISKYPVLTPEDINKYYGEYDGPDKYDAHRNYYISLGDTVNSFLASGGADSLMRNGAVNGRLDLVKIALANGADVNSMNGISLANASFYGYIDIVKFLLENGANINVENSRALMWVVTKPKNIDIIRLLLMNGADVNAENGGPIIIAASHGYTDILRLLYEFGADIHRRDDEALIQAVIGGHIDIVYLLLEAGANVHTKDDAALIEANVRGHTDMVRLLLDYGADPAAREGRALRIAKEFGFTDIVQLLTNPKRLKV